MAIVAGQNATRDLRHDLLAHTFCTTKLDYSPPTTIFPVWGTRGLETARQIGSGASQGSQTTPAPSLGPSLFWFRFRYHIQPKPGDLAIYGALSTG